MKNEFMANRISMILEYASIDAKALTEKDPAKLLEIEEKKQKLKTDLFMDEVEILRTAADYTIPE